MTPHTPSSLLRVRRLCVSLCRSLALAALVWSAAGAVCRAQLVVILPSELPSEPPPVPPTSAQKILPVGAQIQPAKKNSAALPAAPSANLTAIALTLSLFTSGATDGGSVRNGTSWSGNLTQAPTTLTVGGNARDENGWGATGLTLDASAMNYLFVSARRDPGNAASTLFVQFEDIYLRTYVVSVSTSLFSTTALTPVTVPLAAWTVDFGPSQITGWSLGGGGLGTENFRMTFDTLGFTTSAIPEPSTYATLLGTAALALVALRRKTRSRSS